MSTAIIIQAHMSSRRLPNKVLKKYKEYSILDILIKRLKKSKKIKKIIIATSKNKKDIKIVDYCKKNKILYYRGPEYDVLERYYKAAKKNKLKTIIRLTSDCPLIDIKTMDKMIYIFKKKKLDFLSNTVPHPCKFPDGSDIEIFNFKTLSLTNSKARLPSEREHVTFYMWKSKKFKTERLDNKVDLSNYRYTVDYLDDFKLICSMIDKFNKDIENITMSDVINYINANQNKIKYQKKLFRSIGWQKSLEKDKKYLKLQ
tara:strand:- start:477 stop:1250 length:774 start_codon:yes stop_codon:yes gene_type:complete